MFINSLRIRKYHAILHRRDRVVDTPRNHHLTANRRCALVHHRYGRYFCGRASTLWNAIGHHKRFGLYFVVTDYGQHRHQLWRLDDHANDLELGLLHQVDA